MNEKLRELTKEEIKKMLIIAVEHDSYSAKCFAFLLLEYKEYVVLTNKDSSILEKFIDLLSCSKQKEAIKLLKNNF